MVSEQLRIQRPEGGASGPNAVKGLQTYLTKFESSLKEHIDSVTQLQRALARDDTLNFNNEEQHHRKNQNIYEPVPTPFGVVSMPVPTRHGASSTGATQSAASPTSFELLPLLRPSQGQMQVDIELEIHVRKLKRFLDEHVASIEALKKGLDLSLAPEFLSGQQVESGVSLTPHEHTAKADHSSRYSTIVLMSTFTAGLIVAFLQLMQSFLPPLTETSTATYTFHYHLGFGFGFVGLVWNICVAIVAGANTVVESSASARAGQSYTGTEEESESTWAATNDQRRSNDTETSAPADQSDSTLSAFAQARKRLARRSLAFAVAQFLGSAIFGVCIGVLYYPVHSGHILWLVPAVLLPIAFGLAAHDLTKSAPSRFEPSNSSEDHDRFIAMYEDLFTIKHFL
ncbi:hypothetical protein BJ912DRAFT_1078582 [Pholiota molesta]|nr:hypothetical protein BJ912DRAFT_1078582 [Pholiota molesta]